MELIRLENIEKTYFLGQVEVPALRGVSLSIRRGEMVALMGASGSGKTTLMNILGCLDHPTAGQFWLDGQEMSGLTPNQRAVVRSEKLGFVFQNFNLLARTTALQNVLMPLDYSVRNHASAEAKRYARRLLERVGLAERIDHEPSQMSGGQQQRVAIARALVNRPAVVLADEPTGNLDSHTSVEILRMFQQLNAEGITVILVTHDPKVASYAHRTIRLVDGVVEGDTIDERTSPRAESDVCRTDGPHAGTAECSIRETPIDSGRGGESSALQPPRPQLRNVPIPAIIASGRARRGGSGTATAVRAPVAAPEAEEEAPLALYDEPGHAPRARVRTSLLPATWRTALAALRRNKMRSALSALGVIIAVAAVIAMTEIGQGSKTMLQNGIASMGANTIMVMSGAAASGGVTFGTGSVMTLTPEDAEEIGRQCPSVESVAPTVRARTQIVYGNRNWVPNQMSGTTPAFLNVRSWGEMSEGEMFTDRDVRNANKVCVIGETIRRALFDDESPVGRDIRINNVPFRVLGVLGRKGANMMGWDQDDVVLAPWTTIKYRVSGSALTSANQSASAASSSSSTSETVNTLDNLYPSATPLYLSRTASENANTPQPIRFANVDVIQAKAVSAEKVKDAIEEITVLLRERHRIPEGEPDDFNIRDSAEMASVLTSTSNTMSTLLLAVALISLIVGGVGIMNIMLVSVTERTREIGLRMAVGARSHHILRQFLVEAVVLCLLGGGIGILVGRGASLLVREFLRWPTEMSLPAIIAAVVVSVGVGMVFGFYPAWKASRLDPIEALRYE